MKLVLNDHAMNWGHHQANAAVGDENDPKELLK